jgi:hypothetical protein
MHPIPNRAEGVDGTARRRTIHRAVTIVAGRRALLVRFVSWRFTGSARYPSNPVRHHLIPREGSTFLELILHLPGFSMMVHLKKLCPAIGN